MPRSVLLSVAPDGDDVRPIAGLDEQTREDDPLCREVVRYPASTFVRRELDDAGHFSVGRHGHQQTTVVGYLVVMGTDQGL